MKLAFTKHNSALGVSISDYSLEIVELEKTATGHGIKSAARAVLVEGIVENGILKDSDQLAKIFTEACTHAKPTPITAEAVVFGLPESQVYTHTIALSSDAKAVDADIMKELQLIVPLPKDDIVFDTCELESQKDTKQYTILSASAKTVKAWYDFFENKIKKSVLALDIESLAIRRTLPQQAANKPMLLVDIGADTTTIACIDEYGLRYSRTEYLAGNMLTKQLQEQLQIERDEAEHKKTKDGITDRDEAAAKVLKPSIDAIANMITETKEFVVNTYTVQVEKIYIVGGSAQLPGIRTYLEGATGLPTERIDSALVQKVGRQYVSAAGLALRAVSKEWDKKDPVLSVENESLTKHLLFMHHSKDDDNKKPATTQEEEQSQQKSKKMSKEKKELIALLVILVVGVLVIVGVVISKNNTDSTAEQAREAAQQQLENVLP